MEDVLELYEKPLNPQQPVVCIDERPVQLLADARPATLVTKPGQILKRDSEYVRKGTANIFCAVEPKAGTHITKVTKNRKAPQFAKIARTITKQYPKAKTIHLVMDNLNTHKQKSLTDYYGKKRGKRIWERFTPHYTPTHGSWLNQAEIEIGIMSRQCLGKDRVPDLQSLKKRVNAWNRRINRKGTTIDWRFTKKKAREKFYY
jgi:transposase